MSGLIVPRYNLVITYDITPEQEEAFYRFALSEFVPTMQKMGLYLIRAWHTLYGNYPVRQSEFAAEDLETIRDALDSDRFQAVEEQLLGFVTNYERHIFPFDERFQVTPPLN